MNLIQFVILSMEPKKREVNCKNNEVRKIVAAGCGRMLLQCSMYVIFLHYAE